MLTSPRGRLSVTEMKQDKKVTLEWRFQKGDRLRYKLTQSNEITGVLGPGWSITPKVEQFEITFVLLMEITDVDRKGVATVRITFDRLTYKTSFMETEYDSETDADLPESKTVTALKGKSITVSVNPRGEIQCLETEAAQNLLSIEQLESLMQQCFELLPKRPVCRGETWETLSRYRDTVVGHASARMHLDSHELGEMGMKITHGITELRKGGKEAVIVTEAEFNTKNRDYDNNEFRIGSPAAKSEIVWDVDRGIVASMTSATDIDVSWLLIHGSHLRTKTTFKLMAVENQASRPQDSPTAPGHDLVSADELRRMRRALIRVLDRVSPLPSGSNRQVGTRINTAARDGVIPRRVAACMRVITEMRNASEYEEVELTGPERGAVRGAWSVVDSWASDQRIDLGSLVL